MATFDPAHPRFQGFDLIQATYKHVGDHVIRVDVLVHQTLETGKQPTIVRFHGGALVLTFVHFYYHAIVVSPNYRFMPQATGLDIYDDIEDFWTWLRSPVLQELLAEHKTPTQLDLDRTLVAGESAGGLLSINASLTHASEVRAAIATYPSLDPSSPDFTQPRTDLLPFGQSLPESLVENVLGPVRDGGPVSTLVGPEYLSVTCAAIQCGRLGDWYTRGSQDSARQNLLYLLLVETAEARPHHVEVAAAGVYQELKALAANSGLHVEDGAILGRNHWSRSIGIAVAETEGSC
ncbi:alpha/beta hydrolase [Aspergillus foveolatus]|uniref:alpha/beta hydrolase n=1 Tax=Aspergillus foveolatus TaxID=210207 RepID=UPI003CCD4C89